MSRAYRIRVRESLSRVVTAKDGVSTRLEILEILPAEQMAELLAQELEGRGFERQGSALVRTDDGVTISVEPASGMVTVHIEGAEQVDLEREQEGRSYNETGPALAQVRKELQAAARKDLEKQAEREAAKLQSKLTDQLEGMLGDLRKELDQAVNRVTAEALKRKAAQLGQIKELTEDPENGSLTIVVEV
jgi:DNA anti-recombination protein RmuC